MQGINQITARIEAIQAKVERPPIDGAFRAHLDAQLAASRQSAEGNAAHGHDHDHHLAHGTALAMDASAFARRPSVTLGAMVGGIGSIDPTSSVGFPVHHVPDGLIATKAELADYMRLNQIELRNGKLGSHELTAISGSWHGDGRLLPPAAEAWELMRAAAAEDGVDLKAIDTYRTWESQNNAYQKHLAGIKKANVLPPGTSRHGAGTAVDITNGSIIDRADPEWAWLQANGKQFGWYPISNETWHWEFRGV